MTEPKCPYCGEEMKHTAPRLHVKPSGIGVLWQCRYYCESCDSRAPLVDIDCETEQEVVQAARAAALRAKPPKRGRWIRDSNGVIICSECGEEHEWLDYRASFCEDCGAEMEAAADGTPKD